MPDRLYFSGWIADPDEKNVLRQFQKMLERFPHSKLAKRGPVLRVYAISPAEPPLMEREFEPGSEAALIVEAAREFMQADCACEVESYWDLWQFDKDWKLLPAAVTLTGYAPEFENELGDQMRIEFGPDARFLPTADAAGGLRMGQSNLKSLLHLVGDLERGLNLEKRQVWSESGANFAEVLKQALGTFHVN